MKPLALCILIIGARGSQSIGSTADARANDEALRNRFEEEYPKALKTLEELYANATGSATLVTEKTNRDEMTKTATRNLTFATKTPQMAKVAIHEGTTISFNGTNRISKKGLVFCYNRDCSFRLSRDSEGSTFSVASFQIREDGQAPHEDLDMGHRLWLFLRAPYSLYLMPLSQLLSDKRFVTGSVSRVDRNEKAMVKAEFEMKGGDRSPGFVGWIIVSPDEGWILHEYEYKMNKSSIVFRGSIEYGVPAAGARLPKRVVHTRHMAAEGRLVNKESVEINDIKLAEVPDYEFTLANFGLPDLQRPRSGTLHGGYAVWLIATSLLLGTAAVALRFTGKRVRTQ
jgi:hypothetical protein